MNRKYAFLSAITLLIVGVTMTSCSKTDNPVTTPTPVSTTSTFVATLNGASEKPASTTSTAVGSFVGTLNETTRVMSYTVSYSGLSPIAGHLHRVNAANGTGPVEIPFASLTSPIIGSTTITNQARVDSMKNGFYYANLHTAVYSGGEIRGDLKKQ